MKNAAVLWARLIRLAALAGDILRPLLRTSGRALSTLGELVSPGVQILLIGLVVKIFGNVALFYLFGESVARAFRSRTPAPAAAVVLGLVVVTVIKLIPFLGLLFSLYLSVIAWGVVMRTKFGTTENWLRKRT